MKGRVNLAPGYYIEFSLPNPTDFDGESYYFKVGKWYVRLEEGSGHFGVWVVKVRPKLRVRRWMRR